MRSCRNLAELPARLKQTRASLQAEFGERFAAFFRWLFDMGKGIAALGTGADVSAVRTVPLTEGMMLSEAVLVGWPLLPEYKAFFAEKFAQPFTKDLWMQIARFANMTKVGKITADLGNYDDEETGGGSAWPCAIDDFVEHVQAARAGA